MSSQQDQHELITYNKKFKPGTAGVKLTFAPDEMAFSREDMPLRAAVARREVLLSLQPAIDGVSKKPWNNDVLVLHPHEPANPEVIYVSNKNEHDPPFRSDFYDESKHWDTMATIDSKLESRQFQAFTEKSKENTIHQTQKLAAKKPTLVKRQDRYAAKIKEEGIPAVQPPPPFIVKKPKLSKGSQYRINKTDHIKRHHDGVYEFNEAFGEEAWSCCGNTKKDSPGCRIIHENIKTVREWCENEHDFK